jgi:hypothetical protein
MMIIGNQVRLSTGKQFFVSGGVLGIDVDLMLTDGYDGYIADGPDDTTFTVEERQEIADYMIGLWNSFKSPPSPHTPTIEPVAFREVS